MKLDIKICGLKTGEAVEAALEGGASHIGFIFFDKSPRHVTPDAAAKLRDLAKGKARAVAVTVDAADHILDEIVQKVQPDMLQLHGRETAERVDALKQRYGLAVMKAFSIRTIEDLDPIPSYVGVADRFLFDAKPPPGAILPGGNGVPFDWRVLAALDDNVEYMLSGGLNAANIGSALDAVSPRGIDVSSGVERAPGEKSAELIRDFLSCVQRLRNHDDAA